MNNAPWSPRGARAGERNLATGSTATMMKENIEDLHLFRKIFFSVTL
jgi:hypothetical protein